MHPFTRVLYLLLPKILHTYFTNNIWNVILVWPLIGSPHAILSHPCLPRPHPLIGSHAMRRFSGNIRSWDFPKQYDHIHVYLDHVRWRVPSTQRSRVVALQRHSFHTHCRTVSTVILPLLTGCAVPVEVGQNRSRTWRNQSARCCNIGRSLWSEGPPARNTSDRIGIPPFVFAGTTERICRCCCSSICSRLYHCEQQCSRNGQNYIPFNSVVSDWIRCFCSSSLRFTLTSGGNIIFTPHHLCISYIASHISIGKLSLLSNRHSRTDCCARV